jgi:molybdopterin/thiamine biosynthesis adenylyltransferase
MAAFVETLGKINPDVALVPCFDNVDESNVAGLMAQADIVVDASPDFAERYCINAEAVRTRKPVVMAAMNGLECYATTIRPGETPCLACIYPAPPEGWEVTGFPVIAPSSSLIASIAAMEVIKALTGYGRPLANKLLYCDLESNAFSTFNIRRQPDCGVCSH